MSVWGKKSQLINYFKLFAESEERFSSSRSENSYAPVRTILEEIECEGINSHSVLTQYLDGKVKKSDLVGEEPIIYPFGCNQSQKKAVERALSTSLSVIQGPPGTGKTQTILNIIANLMIRGKKVAVASNNNAATENVKEKLDKAEFGLGWLVAELGNRKIREKFFSDLPKIKLQEAWGGFELKPKEIAQLGQIVDTYYEKQLLLQNIRKELHELELQGSIFIEEAEKDGRKIKDCPWFNQLSQRSVGSLREIEHYVRALSVPEKSLKYYWSRFELFLNGVRQHEEIQKQMDVFLDVVICARVQVQQKSLQREAADLEKWLKSHSEDEKRLIDLSKQYLLRKIYDRYSTRVVDRPFSPERYRRNAALYRRYPIVIASTFVMPFSSPWKRLFDFLIIDEASQVSAAAGAACLNYAAQAVIVGDSKQLPMIVKSKSEELPKVAEAFDATKKTILDSLIASIGERLPVTILREHYRCHPDIIEFCNRRFYGGELIAMTKRTPHSKPFEWVQMNESRVTRTVAGSYFNDRQLQETRLKIEELKKQGLADSNIGVIAPYRAHAYKVNQGGSKVVADTVHRFQGRETDVIIFDVVRNKADAFIDDPNLINVAVSRAKDKFILVSAPLLEQKDSNIGALIEYISHLDPESRKISQSNLRSVFDVLYRKDDNVTIKTKKGESPAEAIFRELLGSLLKELPMCSWSFIQEYPLRLLPSSFSGFSEEEKRFMRNGSRLDFLLYDRMNNQPLAAFEVDGASFHEKGTRQADRDSLKNNILKSLNVPLIRFRTDTVAGGERSQLSSLLHSIYYQRNKGVQIRKGNRNWY